MGSVQKINIASIESTPTIYTLEADLIAGRGIKGDRYFDKCSHPKENITLIEKEIIDEFCATVKKEIDPKDFRRNVITKGIPLTNLIGKKVKIGKEVTCLIHEICEPCRELQNELQINNFVKLMVHKAGVRAEILTSGQIKLNDPIEIISE